MVCGCGSIAIVTHPLQPSIIRYRTATTYRFCASTLTAVHLSTWEPNVGLVSLLVADKVEHAVLFEPNPIAVKRAQENLGINRLNLRSSLKHSQT